MQTPTHVIPSGRRSASADDRVAPGGVRAMPQAGTSIGFVVILVLAAVIGLGLALQPAHPLADVTHYKLWARLAATEGIGASYAGDYPDSYIIYPPVTIYGLGAVGWLYQHLVDPSFDRETALASGWLTTAIRLLALGMHLVTGGVVLTLLRRHAGGWAALVGSGLYLLNPGALWDVSVWGQPDSWHALFLLLALWQIGRQKPLSGGAWLALAALTKPQAWALLPLAGLALLRRGRLGGVLRAALGGAAVSLVVLLPFLSRPHLRELAGLPGHISSVMPVASANAHNLWWLVTGGAFPFVLDSEPLGRLDPLTYRSAALLLLVVPLALTLWKAWSARGPWELATLGAYFGHAWFTLTTAAHENHEFMVLPLLCLVWWRSRFLLGLLLIISLLFSFNLLVHDFGLEASVDATLGAWNWRLQMAASALSVAILLAWSVWLVGWPVRWRPR